MNPFNQLTIQPINRHTGTPAHRPTGRAASLGFWNDYALWYEQWLCHNDYHKGILRWVTSLVKPGWRVLDLGAGSGVLSLPLQEKGCEVTALEPSSAMRKLLRRKAIGRHVEGVNTEKSPWEEVPLDRYRGYDLVIACNSLHLCPLGFLKALEKVFLHGPKRIFLVNEFAIADDQSLRCEMNSPGIKFSQGIQIPLVKNHYALLYARIERIRSSFVYHNTQEAISHWNVIKGRRLKEHEKRSITSRLDKHGDHLRLADDTYVGLYYWTRFEERAPIAFKVSGRRNHAFDRSIARSGMTC